MTDESEPPDATAGPAGELPPGAELPARAEPGRDRVPGERTARGEDDTSIHVGDDGGRVLAFPPRRATGTTTSSNRAVRDSEERAERETADRESAEGAAGSANAFSPYGDDPDGEPDFVGTALTTQTISSDPIPGDADEGRPVDWAWVEEWRAGGEPVPWASGLGLAGFSALVVGVAVWVLSAGLAGSPVLAIGVNLLVAGGLAPAMWLSRGLPVLRWIALGSAVGVLVGWVCALTMLPLPTP